MEIVINNIKYKIVKDDNNTINDLDLNEIVTDYYEKFDFIVGDWAYGKVRLKGFYKDNNKKANAINKYSYMDEYIKDYCAYKCKYFVIEKNKKNIDK